MKLILAKGQKVISTSCFVFKSLLAGGDFCCLQINFANSLDPDQARQDVKPDLDPNCLTPYSVEKIQHPKSKNGTLSLKGYSKTQKLIKIHCFADMY